MIKTKVLKNDILAIGSFNYLSLHQKLIVMTANILIGAIGPWQIAIIVLVILLLFGGKKIPEMMRGMGKGIREFKDGLNPDETENSGKNSPEKKA